MKRFATAHWKGSVKQGEGTISTESGVLDHSPYGFNTRFEDGPGTNPEELLGAAHAGCYSMALSMMLGSEGHPPTHIDTRAVVSLESRDDGFSITHIHLDTQARVPDIDEDKFREIAEKAKVGCPLSKVLNAEISLEATLSDDL